MNQFDFIRVVTGRSEYGREPQEATNRLLSPPPLVCVSDVVTDTPDS